MTRPYRPGWRPASAFAHVTVFAATAFLNTPGVHAADWPQWRGPARDGRLAGASARANWPASLTTAWKVIVGRGHSSPVVVQDRVYVFSREGEDEVVAAYELASGRRVWRQSYPVPYTMNPAASGHGKGPKSTPAVASGKVYTFGIAGTFACFEAATGRVVWRKEFGGQFKATSPDFGVAMSPVVEGDLVFAHVGGNSQGAFTAFDAQTGAVRWAWTGDGPGYASPMVVEIAGARQVITQSQSHVIGLSADKGQLLWTIPFKTDYDQNAVTPLVFEDLVVYSGIGQPVRAARIARRGAAWQAAPAWENADAAFYMSTPVRDGERLVGLSHRKKGQFVTLDLRTGRTLWSGEGRQAENASLVASGDTLFALKDDGELVVFRMGGASGALTPLRSYTVAESSTWAHLIPTGDGFLVKDEQTLAFWRIP